MSNIILDKEQIMQFLPQRPPFLFIDKVIELIPEKFLVALRYIDPSEAFFAGHFPGRPIMPGVLIVEALAQAAGVLAYKSSKENNHSSDLYLFAGIDNTRFKRIVLPGDELRLEIEVLKARSNIWKVQGTATVDGEVACRAELMSAKVRQEENCD